MKKQWLIMIAAMLFASPGFAEPQTYDFDNITIKIPVEVKNLKPEVKFVGVRCESIEPGRADYNDISAPVKNGEYKGTLTLRGFGRHLNPVINMQCKLFLGKSRSEDAPVTLSAYLGGVPVQSWRRAKKGAFFRVDTGIFKVTGRKHIGKN